MKKKIKRYKDDEFEFFRQMMWNLGITYPKSIFDRRLNLMTKKELSKYKAEIWELFDKIDQKLYSKIEDINAIMANRAEIEQDPWKLRFKCK